jgi:anti-anti-sigma factor
MVGRDEIGQTTPAGTPLVEIVVDEDLTRQAAVRLNMLLTDALDLRPAQLVVDLAACTYADALAVDVLLTAHRRAWSMGGRLTLRSPSPRIRRLLRLARVDQVFHVTPTDAPPPLPAASGAQAAW